MKIVCSIILLATLFISVASYGDDAKYCTEEYYKKLNFLYRNSNPETAKIVFHVLSCNGAISKESSRGQYVALIGGYMKENQNLIEPLFVSAKSVNNTDAAKIYLDGLWLCSSQPCRNKLKERPFQLPEKDVNKLLTESPPDPLSIPITDPATLDFMWGYFLGTGDTRIVQRIYILLHDNWHAGNSSESIGISKRLVLSSARWSLVSIASQHELAKKVLEKEATPVAKELLKEIRPIK